MYLKVIILIVTLLYLFLLKQRYKQVGTLGYEKARKRYAIFVAILLILQSGLRNVGIGADTYQYMISFYEKIQWSWQHVFQNFIDVYQYNEGKDAGYVLLVKVFSVFSSDYQVYLVFVAMVVFIPMVYFIYKNTEKAESLWVALLLYQALFYSFFSITGIRQALATGLCLLSVEYIKKKKILQFISLIIVGAFIHKSCLLFLPFYWIAQIKKTKLLFISVICTFPVMLYLGKEFTLQLAIISGSENYLGYAEQETAGAYNLTIFYFMISFIGFIKYWKDKDWMTERRYIFNAISLGIFFLPLTFNSANLVRAVQYYSIFILVIIGYIIFSNKGKNIKGITSVIQFFLIIVLLYKLFTTPTDYAFFWEKMAITNY